MPPTYSHDYPLRLSPMTDHPTLSAPATPAIRDQLVKDAQSVPDLIARAQTADPQLAQQLQGKALLTSKTPWGTLAVAAVAYASAKWGFGWDEGTVDLVAGLGLLAGAYLMRAITASPIAGLIRRRL